VQKLLLSMIVLAALPGSTLLAQNIVGTWQGTLQPNGPNSAPQLRIVVKIARSDNESLKATLYRIDQNPTPINANSCSLKGSSLKIAINQLNATYEGTLSSDGNSIPGNFSQGGPTIPLNLARATPETAWAIPEPPPPPKQMSTAADPAFVVATIKPSNPSAQGQGYGFRGEDVVTSNTTVSWLLTFAYSLHAQQVIGGPKWLGSDRYDILGRPDTSGQPSREQLKIMVRKLLAERFQLKFHMEKKELSAYTITVLKTGPKFEASTADPNTGLGVGFGLAAGGGMTLNVRNAPFASIANALQGNLLDKPVVDLTGLTGRYDFSVKFTPDASQLANAGAPPPGASAANLDAPPDIYAAFQQQLGLKLESTKTVVDVMVIEMLEKPSNN
jgi:uncharacterized protein (TIGR03435 family)